MNSIGNNASSSRTEYTKLLQLCSEKVMKLVSKNMDTDVDTLKEKIKNLVLEKLNNSKLEKGLGYNLRELYSSLEITPTKSISLDKQRILNSNEAVLEMFLIMGADLHKTLRKTNLDAVDALNVPPNFYNKKNNCWFNAALEMFWIMGPDFHQLVKKKDLECKLMLEEYDIELKNYENAKNAYDQKMVEYADKMLAYEVNKKAAIENYRNQLISYKNNCAIYETQFNEYKQAVEKFTDEKKNWESSDKTKEEPLCPVELEKPTIPSGPPKVALPKKPLEPFQPADPFLLLDALKKFSDAIQFSDRNVIRKSAKTLQEAAFKSHFGSNEEGMQEDSGSFIEFILSYLSAPKIEIKTEFEGKAGTEFQGFKRTGRESNNVLYLNFNNKTSLQEILDNNFQMKQVDDPNFSIPLEMEEKSVDAFQYSEKQQICQSPPDFMFVVMKRVGYHKGEIKKITTRINFPGNNIINFTKAFGGEKTKESDYEYVLCGTLIHKGTMEEGHNTSNVVGTHPKNGNPQWYRTNDLGGQVKLLSPEQARESNGDGQVYFFRRVKKPTL